VSIARAVPSQAAVNLAAASSVAIAFPNSVELGAMLSVFGFAFTNATNDPPTASDLAKTAGTATIGAIALDAVRTRTLAGPLYLHSALYSVLVTAKGSLTLTLDGGASATFCNILGHEYQGAWDASRLVTSVSNEGNGTIQTASTAASTGPALFVSALMHTNASIGSEATEQSPLRLIAEQPSSPTQIGTSFADLIVNGPTSLNAAWVTNNSVDWIALCAVYREVATYGHSRARGASRRHINRMIRGMH
jgi:hypothetical protein